MLKKILFIYITSISTIFATDITIAVSANVSYAIKPLIQAFNKIRPDTKVNIVLGSSGKLFAQISHAAPYDMFLSANMMYPKALYKNNLTSTSPKIYAYGSLAILSQKERNYCAEIFVLKSPDIKKIAIANPKTAPYGRASVEALKNAKLYKKLQKKFVYGESIAQTLIYATGAADIGLVAKSALYSPRMSQYKEAIHWSEVDESLYAPIEQGVVVLKRAEADTEVRAFYDFLFTPKAKEILKSYGYRVP